MLDNLEEQAYQLAIKLKRISPFFLMRKLRLNYEAAQAVCQKVWLRQHKEAKFAASLIDANYGWDAQLDRVRVKNLEKIKRKKKD